MTSVSFAPPRMQALRQPDVLYLILKHLDITDWLLLASVSRFWQAACESNLLWEARRARSPD